jgi:hypothetical protein
MENNSNNVENIQIEKDMRNLLEGGIILEMFIQQSKYNLVGFPFMFLYLLFKHQWLRIWVENTNEAVPPNAHIKRKVCHLATFFFIKCGAHFQIKCRDWGFDGAW